MGHPLMEESVWYNKFRFDDAEKHYQECLAGTQSSAQNVEKQSSLVDEITRARQYIKHTLASDQASTAAISSVPGNNIDSQVLGRIKALEDENKELRKITENLNSLMLSLQAKFDGLEGGSTLKKSTSSTKEETKIDDDENDDEIDLFGSDDEDDEEQEKIREERLKLYAAKKAKKPALIAKSNIILDIKPWDDETDMKEMEKSVRTLEKDGLLWGASKLVAVGYGIHKLQISCVVEDDKVGLDWLEEEIVQFEDYVQSVDVAAFNKV